MEIMPVAVPESLEHNEANRRTSGGTGPAVGESLYVF